MADPTDTARELESMDYDRRTLGFAVALVEMFPWRSEEPINGADVVAAVNELLNRFGVPVRRSELRCPNGHDGPFCYLETQETHRRVRPADPDAPRSVVIDGYVYDKEEREPYWLECQSCCHLGLFRLPPTLRIEFR